MCSPTNNGASRIVGHLHRETPPAFGPGGAPGFGGPRKSFAVPPSGVNTSGELFKRVARVQQNSVPERLDISRPVAVYNGAASVLASAIFPVEWVTPSAKLACKVGIVFVMRDGASNGLRDAINNWQLTPLIYVAAAQQYVAGQPVFRDPTAPATALTRAIPDAYEVDTTIERIRGAIQLEGINDSDHSPGTWYAVLSAEPRNASMSDGERAELFAKCDIIVPSTPYLMVSGSS